jgi:hypothetical protein
MEKEYHNFIYDEEQIRKFVSTLSPLKKDEVYFVSMSARNKYLTDEERRTYDLGRTEMFARELIKPSNRVEGGIVETYLRVLKSMWGDILLVQEFLSLINVWFVMPILTLLRG